MNSVDEMKDRHERLRFQYYAREFLSRWGPLHHDQRVQFEAEFLGLIREVVREAMEPFAEQLAAAYATMPPAPIIMEKSK